MTPRTVLFAMVVGSIATDLAKGEAPDPVALLRGVEAARENVKAGRIDLTVTQKYPLLPKRPVDTIRLRVSFDGVKRRYDQDQKTLIIEKSANDDGDANFRRLRAMGEDYNAFIAAGLGKWKDTHIRAAYDGIQFLEYSEDLGAHIKDPSKGTPEFVFDPRTLGITVYFRMDDTVAGYLAYRDAKSVSLLGEEAVGDHKAWKVRVIDKYDQTKTFWIESSADFPVLRSEFELYGVRVQVNSEYPASPRASCLPSKSRVDQYDKSNQIWLSTTVELGNQDYQSVVDPKLWTLVGLGMPLGESVIDQRINRVVGHFDGQGLSPTLPEAIRKSREQEARSYTWAWVLAGAVVLAACGAVVARRYNLLRQERV